MKSYSLDLRERVIQAWQEDKRQSWIAETYRVGLSTLKEWIKRFRETGGWNPYRVDTSNHGLRMTKPGQSKPWRIAYRTQRWKNTV
jgi:transposase-like protein